MTLTAPWPSPTGGRTRRSTTGTTPARHLPSRLDGPTLSADSPPEALRRRSEALIVIVGYPESGWTVTGRREPSGPLLVASGRVLDDACVDLLALLDAEPPRRKLKLKPRA